MSVTTKIILEPEFLTKNYKDVVLEKIKEKYNNTCNKNHGYILEVLDLVYCELGCLSRGTGFCEVLVKFNIKNLLPKIDDIYTGKINILTEKYIICCVDNKMMIFIDKISLSKNYKYNSGGVCWTFNKIILRVNDIINVKLVDVQYNDRKFICIGEII